MKYFLKCELDTNGTYLLTSRDISEFTAVGESIEEALSYAIPMMEECFEIYMSDNRAIPDPTPKESDEIELYMPSVVGIKVSLYNETIRQGLKRYSFGNMMGWKPSQIERFFKVTYPTKMETIEAAARKLGKHIELSLT